MANRKQNQKESGLFPKRKERVAYSGGIQQKQKKTDSKKRQEKNTSKKPKREKNKKKSTIRLSGRQTGILILLLFTVCLLFLGFHKNGAEVFLEKESMGILKDTGTTAEKLTDALEAQLKEETGTAVQINEKITVRKIHIPKEKKKNVCTMEYLLPKLRNAVTYKVEASVIFVDGSKAAALAKKEDADTVLRKLKELATEDIAEKKTEEKKKPQEPKQTNASSSNSAAASEKEATKDAVKKESSVKIDFVEKVTIEKQFVDATELLSVADAIKLMQGTTPVTETYTIQEGDTLGKIASAHNMSQKELLEMNEGMTTSTPVIIGRVMNVKVQKPMVSVKSVETQELIMVEKKTYQYQDDPTKPKSYQRVIQRGRDGQKKSTIQITRINNFVTEEKEISKEIIQEAVPEIIARGTA